MKKTGILIFVAMYILMICFTASSVFSGVPLSRNMPQHDHLGKNSGGVLYANSDIFSSIAFGYEANLNNGASTIAIGYQAAKNNTGIKNIAIGYRANSLGDANNNIAIGYETMYNGCTTNENIGIGNFALYNDCGSNTIAIGIDAGFNLQGPVAIENTFIGRGSGFNTTVGAKNTFIGPYSGYSNTNGSGNIFIGPEAGYTETGSNKLIVSSTSTTKPLIYGDFANKYLEINGQLRTAQTTTPTATCNVGGAAILQAGSSDNSGYIAGTGIGNVVCTLTFSQAWNKLAFCVASLYSGGSPYPIAVTNTNSTSVTFTFGAINNPAIFYICL